MVTLTFFFNEKILIEKNLTRDDLLVEIRQYSQQYNIIEKSVGCFEKDGEDAMCLLLKIALKLLKGNKKYVECLNKLELDVDGQKEDCIESVRRWYLQKKYMIQR